LRCRTASTRKSPSGGSYGFRPKRGQHDALDALAVGITDKKVNFILDADVRSFFEEVSQPALADPFC
jgi:retron-type reverse transcriptase